MTESPAVQASASSRIAEGVRALRVDLRDCTTMDSTFSGTLLALKRQLEAAGGSLTLLSPSAKVRELLEQMGLEDFYAVELTNRIEGPWVEIATAPGGTPKLRRVILDAHEELARIPGPAGHTFRPVADELRREGAPSRRPDPETRRADAEIPSSRGV